MVSIYPVNFLNYLQVKVFILTSVGYKPPILLFVLKTDLLTFNFARLIQENILKF